VSTLNNEFQYSRAWETEEVYTSANAPLFPEASSKDQQLGSPKLFSAVDMVAYVTLPTKKTYKLGNLATLSISSHRDKFPVTGMGSIKIRGTTGGHRMIGGTMVFSSYDRNVWFKLIEGVGQPINRNIVRIMPDDMPLFDITISFVNEDGDIAITGLLGVSILDEGETYSMDNVSIMESYSYMAIEKIPYQPVDLYSKSNIKLAGEFSGTIVA